MARIAASLASLAASLTRRRRNRSLHPSPSFYMQFQGYTLGLLTALALAGATLLFGKHVVAPLGLRGMSEGERSLRLARLNRDALARVLLLLYLVYPGVCRVRPRDCRNCADAPPFPTSGVSVAIFAVFSCAKLNNGVSYLDADSRIVCYDAVHMRYMGGAAMWLLLVPIGVPAFFLWLLRRFKVPQMVTLLSDNAWLREGIKLAWAEGLVQPANSGKLTVDSITTPHLEALYAFFMHDMAAEDAVEILSGARPPLTDATAAAVEHRTLWGKLAAAASHVVHQDTGGEHKEQSKRISIISAVAAKTGGAADAAARRALILASVLAYLRSSGLVVVPPMRWEIPDELEAAALTERAQDACVHSSGLRCAEVPALMRTALGDLSFLFAGYRMDCWCARTRAFSRASDHADAFAPARYVGRYWCVAVALRASPEARP